MAGVTKKPAAPKTAPVERVQFRATLDRRSLTLLQLLSRHMELKRSTLLAQLILKLKANKKLTAEFIHYSESMWPRLRPHSMDTAKLFNWPVDVDQALHRLSWDAIGTGNKSETIRVLIAFFAHEHYKCADDKVMWEPLLPRD